jgi:hypothetical protein
MVFLALQCAVHLAATAVVAHEKPFCSAAHPLALRHDIGEREIGLTFSRY